MKRFFLSALAFMVLAGCSTAEKQIFAPIYEVALTPANGEVRLIDIRQGMAHLEATCDVDDSGACGVAAAAWCESAPKVYDQQRYMTGSDGEVRTVWLASCQPRLF